MDKTFETILCTKRAHQSPGELDFVAALHKKLNSMGHKTTAMGLGNVVVTVPAKGAEKLKVNVMFSCHVDTVHTAVESNGSKQALAYDPNKGHIFLAEPDKSTCLGADDGAGIYIMLKMLEAKVPGTYVFHRGEERGCIGSREMVAKHPEWLKEFDACIAFDRPGTDEVIATQSGQQCASVAYSQALADALNAAEPTFKYAVSHRGVVTDSKMYSPFISECINLGVGYFGQHGSGEYQDWNHLQKLAVAVCKLNWQALIPSRDPVPAQKPVPRFSSRNMFPEYEEEDFPPRKLSVTPIKPPTLPAPDISFQAEVAAAETYTELEALVAEDCALIIIGLRAELAAATARADVLANYFGVEASW